MLVIASNNASFLVSPALIRSLILPSLFQFSEVYANSQFPSQVLLWLQLKSLLLYCFFANFLDQKRTALFLLPWTLHSKAQEVPK